MGDGTEARKGWGQLVSVSNDICRLTSAYIAQKADGGLENELVQEIFGLVIAFPIALTNNLRNRDEQNNIDLKTIGLSEDHYNSVLHAGIGNGRTWRWVVTLLSACIHEAAEREYIPWEIVRERWNKVSKEQTETGGICCRIAETPLNFAVSIHVRTVLGLFSNATHCMYFERSAHGLDTLYRTSYAVGYSNGRRNCS